MESIKSFEFLKIPRPRIFREFADHMINKVQMQTKDLGFITQDADLVFFVEKEEQGWLDRRFERFVFWQSTYSAAIFSQGCRCASCSLFQIRIMFLCPSNDVKSRNDFLVRSKDIELMFLYKWSS